MPLVVDFTLGPLTLTLSPEDGGEGTRPRANLKAAFQPTHNDFLPRDGIHGIVLPASTPDSWSTLNPAD